MYLLDTNVVSEVRKVAEGRADANVVAWQAQVDPAACFISSITLMELEMGILRIERRDALQGGRLRYWLDNRVIPEFSDRVLPVDAAVALRCARLHVPDPRSERDALVAATALVHGLMVVTRNTGDFVLTGAALLNPWQPWTVQESPSNYVVDSV